jgi:hypothetical protein
VCVVALDLKKATQTNLDEISLHDGSESTIVGTLLTAAEHTTSMDYLHELFHSQRMQEG